MVFCPECAQRYSPDWGECVNNRQFWLPGGPAPAPHAIHNRLREAVGDFNRQIFRGQFYSIHPYLVLD